MTVRGINLCKTADILSMRVMHTESIIMCISHLCDICTEGFVVPIATHCKTMQSTTKHKHHRCKNVIPACLCKPSDDHLLTLSDCVFGSYIL